MRTYGTVPYLAVSVGEDLTQAVPVLDELFPLSLNLGHYLAAAHHVTQHLVREHPPHISAKQPNLLIKQYGTVPTYRTYHTVGTYVGTVPYLTFQIIIIIFLISRGSYSVGLSWREAVGLLRPGPLDGVTVPPFLQFSQQHLVSGVYCVKLSKNYRYRTYLRYLRYRT